MAELPKTLKDFTVFLAGDEWGGRVLEGTPPKIALKTEEYLAGGMAAPVDIDMGTVEKLECELTFAEYAAGIYQQFGVADTMLTLRGAASNGTTAESVVYEMRGLIREIDPGAFKRGDQGSLKVSISLSYLKITIGGAEVIEIDPINTIRSVGGKDQLADIRNALGS